MGNTTANGVHRARASFMQRAAGPVGDESRSRSDVVPLATIASYLPTGMEVRVRPQPAFCA